MSCFVKIPSSVSSSDLDPRIYKDSAANSLSVITKLCASSAIEIFVPSPKMTKQQVTYHVNTN